MDFPQRGQRSERRRRVLLDENRDQGAVAGLDKLNAQHPSKESGQVRSYSDAALDSKQPPITCVIPRRLWTLAAAFLSGLIVVTGVIALHIQTLQTAPARLRPALTAFDVTERGSLADWLSSLLLGGAALYSGAVFQLRRHKLDDYRGRYGFWIFAIFALIVASLDAATGLHEAAAAVLLESIGASPTGPTSMWWLPALGATLVLLLARTLIEIRPCRLATMFALLASLSYTAATCKELAVWPDAWSPAMAYTFQSAMLLTGNLCVFLTVLSYSRYVYLDAQGRLQRRRVQRTAPAEQSPVEQPSKLKSEAVSDRPTEQAASVVPKVAPVEVKVPKEDRRPVLRIDGAHRPSKPVAAHNSSRPDEAQPSSSKQSGRSKRSKAERRRQHELPKQSK